MNGDSYLYCNFVKAKEGFSGEVFRNFKGKRNNDGGTLSGRDAKDFYDTLVSSTRTNNEPASNSNGEHSQETQRIIKRSSFTRKSKKDNKHPKVEERTKIECRQTSSNQTRENNDLSSRIINKYLQYAQEGNLNELKMLLEDEKVDINASDGFGWTAIMCAAFSGHRDVVEYLLKHGASWKDLKNSHNQTVLDLLNQSEHQNIIELLVSWDSREKPCRGKSTKKSEMKPFWCDVCQREVKEEQKKHLSSTAHLFNCQHKPKETHFAISTNNRGYKMMVRSGWDDDKGLGPGGEGRKYPIKTVLKRDRYGLGNSRSSKPRVTHFGPNDESAIKQQKKNERKESQRTLSKKQKRMKESKEKAWERNLRMYMNT